MGKCVSCLQPGLAPCRRDRRSFGRSLFCPAGRWPAKHSTEQTAVWPPFQKPGTIVSPCKIGDAETRRLWSFRQLPGQFCRRSSRVGHTTATPRANPAGRRTRCTDRCSQIHHCLGVVARSRLWSQRAHLSSQFGFRCRQGCMDIEHSRHHALDIAIHHRSGNVIGNGGDGGGGIGTDTRQPKQSLVCLGKFATMRCGHLTRAF